MDSNIVGGKFVLDTSDLKKGLADANRQLRLANSEFQATAASMEDWTKSEEGLIAKQKQLNSSIDVQKQKISALENEYRSVVAAKGADSKEAENLKIKINNETRALNENERQLSRTNQMLNELGDESNEAGKNVEDLGKKSLTVGDIIKSNLISEAIIGGFKSLVSLAKEAASALVDVGKAALDSYAEAEQLIGGVDTLFKESSGKVQEYANNAYKTAGMSANKYMETVTSFSASLLQSLDGDTEKAASAADAAITDMADNANKMGTSMEMIQNAYQGFAKQNYTMLDNLKLGYGGTKTEMERLLDDASKLSGQKYDISNLNEVYEAIHVVQTKLGITGTTAKEASETISGSLASMKSAWQNLLAGLANADADFELLADNLVDSLFIALGNVLPRVETIVNSIVELIPSLIEKISVKIPEIIQVGANIFQALITGITTTISKLSPIVNNIIITLVNTILTQLPAILEMGIQIVLSLINGITNNVDMIVSAITTILQQLVQIIIDNLPLFLNAALLLITGLSQALLDNLPLIIDALLQLVNGIITGLTGFIPQLLEGAIQLFSAIINALPIVIQQLLAALPNLINSLLTFLISSIPVILDAAIQLFNAIIDALPIIAQQIVAALPNLINSIVTFLISSLPVILDAAIQLLYAIIDALPFIIQTLIVELPKIKTTIIGALAKAAPQLLQAAIELFSKILLAIPKIAVELGKKIPDIIKSIVKGLKDGHENMKTAGLDLIKGLWEGIKKAKDWLLDKIKGFAKTITKGIKDFFGIKSPSKLFRDEIGLNLARGIGVGFEKEIGSVKDTMKKSLNGITNSIIPNINVNSGLGGINYNNQNGLLSGGKTIVVNQTINSPKALSRAELYRQTKNIATTIAQQGG